MCLSHSRKINHRRCSRQPHVPPVFSHGPDNHVDWNLVNGIDLRPVYETPARFEGAANDITSQQRVFRYLEEHHDYHLPWNATPIVATSGENQPENEPTVMTTINQSHIDYLDLTFLNNCKARLSNKWNYVKFKARYVMELLISNLIGLSMANTTDGFSPINQNTGTRLLNQQDIPDENDETQLDAEVENFITSTNSRNFVNRRRSEATRAIILSKQESYSAYEKIIIVLNQTKLSNFLLLLSYLGLLIKSINYESLARHWAQLKTLNLQNFQSRVMNVGFPDREATTALTAASVLAGRHLSSMPSSYNLMLRPNDEPATSLACWSFLANGRPETDGNGGIVGGSNGTGANLVGATTDICYYLLIVTLMDFLNNLHWYHSEQTIKPNYLGREASEPMRRLQRRYSREDTRLPLFRHDKNVSWLRSAWDILTSPRHLLPASYVGLIMVMGPLPGTLGALISFHNLLNQIVRHGFNLYRVIGYIDLLATRDAHNINDSAYLPGYYEINSNLGNSSRRVRGWSYWPVSLEDDGINNKSTSNFYKTCERFLMLSQILGVKVTIFTLLIHLDSLESRYSFGGLILFLCLVESFLAMHSQYDKYYSRYIHQSPQLKSERG